MADPVKAGVFYGFRKGKQSWMRGISAIESEKKMNCEEYKDWLRDYMQYLEETVNLDIKRALIYQRMNNYGEILLISL